LPHGLHQSVVGPLSFDRAQSAPLDARAGRMAPSNGASGPGIPWCGQPQSAEQRPPDSETSQVLEGLLPGERFTTNFTRRQVVSAQVQAAALASGATKAASCTSPPNLPRLAAAAAARMESEVASTIESSNSEMRYLGATGLQILQHHDIFLRPTPNLRDEIVCRSYHCDDHDHLHSSSLEQGYLQHDVCCY
jgi:hypothetical protein